MNKVTYLFGAGASCGALPIVGEIPGRISKLISKLKSDSLRLDATKVLSGRQQTKWAVQSQLIEDLEWLLFESGDHASVDTFAKKLYLKGDTRNLWKLKMTLSVFFILEQISNKPDSRYDAFYASLLTKEMRIPAHVKIVSWNYDYQFELSYARFSDKKDVAENMSRLGIMEKVADSKFQNSDKFSIYKINGSAGIHDGVNKYTLINNWDYGITLEVLGSLVDDLHEIRRSPRLQSSLSFAWEEESSSSEGEEDKSPTMIEKAIESIKDTVALVVIGYSFPFFNRDVDREIIGAMENLKRVYFQIPKDFVDGVKERFQAIRDDIGDSELIAKTDTSQFFLPSEL